MKRLLLVVLFLFSVSSIFAFNVSDSFTKNSRFWRNSVAVSFDNAYNFSIGTQFDLTEHRYFDNHIYGIKLPILLKVSDFGFALSPFYYPDNANNASAYGGKFTVSSKIREDQIENSSSVAYLSVGYADQKANYVKNGIAKNQEHYKQVAYELGLNFDYFDTYAFDVMGTYFQYPNGIKEITDFGGVLDQQELADLGTLDYVLYLPRSAVGARINWKSATSNSNNYIYYR